MKVAFVIGRFPSLSETFILDQITGLIERGHEVDIYAERPVNNEMAHAEIERYGLIKRTHYLPTPPRNFLKRIWQAIGIVAGALVVHPAGAIRSLNVRQYGRLAASLKLVYAMAPLLRQQHKYDVIHCHFGPYGQLGNFLHEAGLITGKLVTTFHGADVSAAVRKYGPRVYAHLFSSGDLFLPISDYWRSRLIELGCPAEKIIVHRMGINCDDFAFKARSPDIDGTVRFISVCRLVEKKGIEYAIRAIAALARTGRKATYDVVGDGPLRSSLQQLAAELGVQACVRFHGWRERREVMALLEKASVFVAPSVTSSTGEQEGVPVALMEAMAMGLPVISTWHSGIPELVEDGRTGLLVHEKDAGALCEKFEYLVDHPHVWIELSLAGRAMVEESYNIQKLNDKLVRIFDGSIGASSVARNGAGHRIEAASNRRSSVVRYAYVKANNVVEEVERVLQREGQLPEGGPDAYVAHFLNLVGTNPALLISTHFHPSDKNEYFTSANISAISLYWHSRKLKRFGRIAKLPLGTFLTRAIGSVKIFLYLVKFRPDRVLCWASSFTLWATYLASATRRGTTFVYCRHNRLPGEGLPWYQQVTGLIDKWIMRRAAAVIVHGPYLKQQMINVGVDPAKILEFNWSFKHFADSGHNDADRNLKAGGESVTILFIGRLQKSKGVFDLLDAVSDRLHDDASLKLVYAGDGSDLVALQRLVAERRLGAKVQILGRVPHDSLPALIAQSRFVVTPTQSWFPEGRCMATMEGLVMRKPVVAPDFGPFPFLVQHGTNGLLFKPDSVDDLRQKISQLLDDEALYQRLVAGTAESSRFLQSARVNFGEAVRIAF